ncbi:MAG: FAD-binding oxidoreductase [Legionella sp.]|nr:FAD-binding oxidoreductase [Legionella sp.]
MLDIFIIGAGVAGIGAALELAERGYKVTLIEQETLGFGSSSRNPGRMGHGFHYIDADTAKMYLRASIQVQRKFSGYLVGKDKPFDHPLRHGRYFITKNSDNSPEEILRTYQAISEEYQRLIAEDPHNAVFGPPEKFFRILKPSEYEGLVNPDIVELGVETAEHLFEWSHFSKDIHKKISAHKNIRLLEYNEVTHIEKGTLEEPRFTLHVTTKCGESKKYKCDFLINSTWQNIEKLNAQIGISMIPGARTNRLKCLLIVKLPESLLNANSMFFCMGQHCMFSNMGNGFGMMTFAQVTNMEASSDLELSLQSQRLLNNEATCQEKYDIARQMLKGVSKYIPEMANATIVDVKYGIVQTAGKLSLQDLTNPNSSFHKRDYDGIREEQVGLISNPCMKLFYFIRNGQIVSDLLEAQIRASSWNTAVFQQISLKSQQKTRPLHPEVKRTIRDNLDRYTDSTSFSSVQPSFLMQIVSSPSIQMASMLFIMSSLSLLAFYITDSPSSVTPGALAGVGITAYVGNFFAKNNLRNQETKTRAQADSTYQTIVQKQNVVNEIQEVVNFRESFQGH